MFGRMIVIWKRAHVWEDDSRDVLEQASGFWRMIVRMFWNMGMFGRMMGRMFWNRGDVWEDDGEDVLEQGGCLGG